MAPEMRDGWFPGLPYPLDDMRPQGFLGRQFAHRYAERLQVASDPNTWQEDEVLHALSVLGADTAGNYILGEVAYRRHLETMDRGYPLISDEDLESAYGQQAAIAMQAGVAGSSAGGEFPKFTACRQRAEGRTHVIVKFSGNDNSPGVLRWSDLLVCEHLALEALTAHLALPAASSTIHRHGRRTFLEVVRFDRHGEFGRSPVCTWAALDAALFGMAGEPGLPLPQERADWLAAAAAAVEFWHSAASDRRIGSAFRAVCRLNGKELKRLRALVA